VIYGFEMMEIVTLSVEERRPGFTECALAVAAVDNVEGRGEGSRLQTARARAVVNSNLFIRCSRPSGF